MRPKGAKGAVHQVPNHKWAHLSQFWPQIPTTSGPELTKDHPWATIQPMASGNHQRPPAQLQARIPLHFMERLFLPQCTTYSRFQEWCIYGIIYHYAPFLLRNLMVTLSGPSYVIPIQVPNPSPILKEDVSAIQAGNSLRLPEDHLRTPTTWPCRG
ncbi:hypothetical protein O181_090517 [Austropuccinia psidii MF-1]|uniref:Uncharacterized protein n=1 Tax=Austropuccinia psidii MF-1 TaxID=1389203 RepID=A0A9Q3IVP3_9BASI|nr:hypothetical protein [Austropuccinia psidii MF-1]